MLTYGRGLQAALGALSVLALLACSSSRNEDEPPIPEVSVIPLPQEVTATSGAFTLRDGAPVIFAPDPESERIARYFTELVARSANLRLEPAAAGAANTAAAIDLRLEAVEGVADEEGYSLHVSPERIVVSARSPRGLFYGTITLWQLITAATAANYGISLESVTINDRPRFKWRGLMLDVARHFMAPDLVKQMIDWMALHKLNTLHWHLTDDQGWRIEIKEYRRLTEVGAWRVPAGAAGTDPASGGVRRYGGFYTQDEVRDIVRYAAERYITVVPEIEMPGHAQAAIAAYPQFGSLGDSPRVSPDWGIHTYLFNVEEDTFAFLESVLTEVMALFPSPYIHVGGDEAAKDQWQAAARVQMRMRELGVADETALQGYFVHRIDQFLRSKGRRLIGWDEILEGGLPADAAVMSWRGMDGGREAARQGHDVVMAPAPDLYFDHLQSDAADEPPGRPGTESLADVYSFEAVPEDLTAEQASHILGVQANLWTEHVRTPERVQHMVFPRLAALAEVAWSPQQRRDWRGFLARMPDQLDRYRALGIQYAQSAFKVAIAPDYNPATEALQIRLSTQTELGKIRYTLDGTDPTPQSSAYDAPIAVKAPVEIRAASFLDGRPLSVASTGVLDAVTLRTRTNGELRLCGQKLPLRLEDDAPFDGARAVFLVDIMDPCWIFPGAALDGVTHIDVRVGQLPYNFQLWKDASGIVTREPATETGELLVYLDSCEGELLVSLSLAPAVTEPALTDLSAPILAQAGTHDLCFVFTGKSPEPLWVIDAVSLHL
ncbi:MAG TPA: family 20 glycosylhydrolase [Steroidobacteraceae bacterium]|nr:family 20 glycosylhydrolase [Steroidobacteraceae bacterium]